MPRPKHDPGALLASGCKVRKRGCSSCTSTSSSVLKNYRFKRGILVGRRGGTSTPLPTWWFNARWPCSMAAGVSECSQFRHSHAGGKEKQPPVSARKLATALWELNGVPTAQTMGNLEEERRVKTGVRGSERMARSAQWGSLPAHLSDPSHSPASETMKKSGFVSHKRRAPVVSQNIRLNERCHGALDSGCSGSVMEMETHSQDFTPTSSAMGVRSRLKDLSNSLAASKQLLKLFNHIWGHHEQHSSTVSLFSVLHSALEQACVQVDQLMEEQRSKCDEIDHLKRWFMEEKTAWKSMVQDRIKSAVQPVVDELKLERKLRQRTERLNQKIGMELAETKTALVNVSKALQSERRSREIIEQICNEFVRGIGEDKAQVEEMKRESAMAQEELEKEREMLQLADIWREERVQMKLSEAKHHFEEKNAAVDQLRNELEAFLATTMLTENKLGFMEQGNKHEVVAKGQLKHPCKIFMRTATSADGMNEEGKVEDGEEAEGNHDEVSSMDSDLHSIELNMDNSSKNYSWGYAARYAQADRKLAPLEEKFNERSLGREKMSRGSFSLEKGLSEDTGWGFDNRNFPRSGEVLDQCRLPESTTLPDRQSRKLDPDVERYKSLRELRDHLLSGSRIASAR